jgi:hypothetical protein
VWRRAPDCFIIAIDGRIEVGDHKKFKEIIRNNKITHALVDLSSSGSIAVEGLGIGYTIKELGFSTRVMTTDTCTSACAFIWIAGRERYLHGNIGFHTGYLINAITREIIKDASGQPIRSNQNIEAYYKHLGLSDLAIHWLTSPGPGEMIWMDAKLASDIGISAKIPHPPMMTVHRKDDSSWEFLSPLWEFFRLVD